MWSNQPLIAFIIFELDALFHSDTSASWKHYHKLFPLKMCPHFQCVLIPPKVPHAYIYSMETLVRTGQVVFVFSAVKPHLHVYRAQLCVELCDWICYRLGGDQETREIRGTIRFLKAFERKWAVLCWTDDRTVRLEAVWSVIELNLVVFVRHYNRASGCEYNDVNGEVSINTPVKNKHIEPVPVSPVCFASWLKKNKIKRLWERVWLLRAPSL